MKKLFYWNFLAITLVFASCSSDDNNDNNNNGNGNQTECEIATEATADAKQDYDAATNENFVAMCNAYKAALQNQQEACGDEDGAIQSIIDSLGDCPAPSVVEGTLSVNAGSMNTVFTTVNVVREGGMVKVSGESVTGTYTIYFEVAEDATGDNTIQNFEMMLTSVFTPVEGEFNSNIETNTDGTLTGTFNGIVKNNDNGHVELTNGIIDLTY